MTTTETHDFCLGGGGGRGGVKCSAHLIPHFDLLTISKEVERGGGRGQVKPYTEQMYTADPIKHGKIMV